MTTVEVLREARRLIAEKGWCQRAFALDAQGVETHPSDFDAQFYCMRGALMCVGGKADYAWVDAYVKVPRVVKPNITLFNDAHGRTKDEVLAAFDKAIALAESEP